jgi:glycosyltransferase involved in cell wall biosynthesis
MLARMDVAAPDYSIVLPAYNEEALLPATLARLRDAMAGAPLVGEVVVCDNNSTDGTERVARAAGARVVFEPVNQISRARNAGARAARGRLLVFVDADTLVPAPLLHEALEALVSGRACGGGAAVRMEGVSGGVMGRMVRFWNAVSSGRRLAAGSFVFVRREAFEAVGGFSERVYASEEIWLSRAVSRWGRPRGLPFVILRDHPVLTSGRKAAWYPAPLLLAVMVGFLLFPFLLRSRRYCWLWYQRPARRVGGGSRLAEPSRTC